MNDNTTNTQDEFSRRDFMQWLSAITALLTTEGCIRQPLEKIVPYARMPEDIIPGNPLFYASSYEFDGFSTGILAESHMGRPTKIEGNELHPASLGATDVFAQASILDLYDPDRSQVISRKGFIGTWTQFSVALRQALYEARVQEEGVRLLTTTVTSPTLTSQIRALQSSNPNLRWHQYQAISRDNSKEGTKLSFGSYLDVRYDFSKADVIVSLDDDFLSWRPGKLAYTRQFTQRRSSDAMNRLYAIESTPTLAGAMADHRIACRPSDVVEYAAYLAKEFGIQNNGVNLPPIGSAGVDGFRFEKKCGQKLDSCG